MRLKKFLLRYYPPGMYNLMAIQNLTTYGTSTSQTALLSKFDVSYASTKLPKLKVPKVRSDYLDVVIKFESFEVSICSLFTHMSLISSSKLLLSKLIAFRTQF